MGLSAGNINVFGPLTFTCTRANHTHKGYTFKYRQTGRETSYFPRRPRLHVRLFKIGDDFSSLLHRMSSVYFACRLCGR